VTRREGTNGTTGTWWCLVRAVCTAVVACVGVCGPVRVAGAAELLDRVMAVANGEVILLSDVRAAQRLSLIDSAGPQANDAAAVAALIERALVLDEVNRYAPPDPQPDAVRAAVEDVRRRFASAGAFAATLAEVGVTEAQLAERVRQDLRIRAYLTQRFNTDTPANSTTAIADWVAGLRRRASILDLSLRN
jgi:hypothetical protein